jgi:hypothetical protein
LLGDGERDDGVLYLRINPLGAWCLGVVENYVPEVVPVRKCFKVLPNRDVVVTDPRLSPADILFLDRFASRSSDEVWRLEGSKILTAVAANFNVAELQEYLVARSHEPIPQTVEVFLSDLAERAGQLEDLGTARLIACKDPHLAQLLRTDRRLGGLCQLSGDRHLVFRSADEPAVRKALGDLGYVLPPPR